MSIKLNSGERMPIIGLGTWKTPKELAADAVYNAIKIGYRLIDGAALYDNEVEVGQGVNRAIKEGIVTRKELFITTKLWSTFHAREHVHQAIDRQLKDWNLDYFDLYLIHTPAVLAYVDPAVRYPPGDFVDGISKVEPGTVPISETWKAMEELSDAGKAKSIGVSNFQGSLLLDLLRVARIPPAVVQNELHPYLTQEPFVQLARLLGIAITAFSSLGSLGYVEIGVERGVPSLLEVDVVKKIAQRTGRTPAQVLLRWSTQRGIAVIPKSSKPERLAENLASIDFDLTEEDLKTISALNRNIRFDNPADLDPRLSIFA